MRGLKIFTLIVGGALVLLVILVGLGLTPAVQTWAAHKALARQPGTSGKIGSVNAGFSRAKLTDVRIVRDGIVFAAEGITAEYSAWEYLVRNRLDIEHVTATGIEIDLRNALPAVGAETRGTPSTVDGTTVPATSTSRPPDSAPTPFRGLLGQMELPIELRIAKLSAHGRAHLSETQSATFELEGSGIQTGEQGRLHWTAELIEAADGSAVSALRSTGNAVVHIAADHRLEALEVDTTATVEGPNLPTDRLTLTARAAQPDAGGDESLDVRIGIERNGRVEPLVSSTARYGAAAREFAGSWYLTVRSEQVAAMLAGFGLPELAANGAGKFTFHPDDGSVTASGSLQVNATRLEKVSPDLAAIGSLQLKTSFDGGFADNAARLERFQLDATTADGRNLAQINTAQRIGFDLATKRASFADSRAELARITVQALPLAWAQPFVKDMAIESGELSLALAVEAEPDGSRIRARSLEPLIVRAATLRRGEQQLLDRATLSARPQIDYSATQIVAELGELSIAMPAGDALTGRLTANVSNLSSTPAIAFTSQLRGTIVAALRPYLPLDPGPLALVSNSEGHLEGNMLHLAKTTMTITREGGELLGAMELQQPIIANLEDATFTAANPDAVAAQLQLGEVPLAWGEAFVKNARFAGVITGVTMDATLRSMDDVVVVTTAPLGLRGVSATMEGEPMVQNLDLMADFSAGKRGEAITYELRRLELREATALLATIVASGDGELGESFSITAKGNLDADVAALMNQPGAAAFATLSRGRLTTAFEAVIGESTQVKAAVAARNLIARDQNQALGDLEFTVTATLRPDSTGVVSLPLTLTNANRRSDLALDGSFGKSSDGKSLLFSGKIASTQLFIDDFTPLAAVAPAGEQASAAPSRDTEPFWKAAQGKVQMNLVRVVYGEDYVISGIRGGVTVTPGRIALDGLEGRLNENPFKSSAAISFSAQQPKPYALTGSADVNNFDVGAFLRAANPKDKPAMESKVNVVARLNGNGATIGDLVKNIYGQFDLNGSQGVLRALGRRTQTASTASALLGIAGILTESKTTSAIAEVTAAFSELRFDNFRMQIERGEDLTFKMTNIEFVSPLMRTTGSGRIANRGDAPVQNQPMEIQLQFGAKDQLAQLLTRVGALGPNLDDRGYRLLQRSFTLGGTPANPDSGSLWTFLLREAAAAGMPALQDLLNRRK